MRLSERFVSRIFVFLCVFIGATSAHPSTALKLSFEGLVGEADLIVKGRVEELNTRQTYDQRSITTLVTVSVKQQFKGAKFSLVTIEQLGGSAGDVALGVPGQPEFSLGEDVILFLKRQRSGRFKVVGGKQGKFTVRLEPASGNSIVEDFARRNEALEAFLERLTHRTKGNQ